MTSFTNQEGSRIVTYMITCIQENKEYLSDIDGAIGDGDHGINMNKGLSLIHIQMCIRDRGMMGSMNMMMYMSTGMIAILAINWPLGMSFYWLVNSVARVIQNIIIHKFFIKDQEGFL